MPLSVSLKLASYTVPTLPWKRFSVASLLAVQLRHRVEAYLGRGLTAGCVRKCEEIIINFKPWVPLRYLEGLGQTMGPHRKHIRTWSMFYYPLYALARSFRGYTRREDLVFIRGKLAGIYHQCDLMAGDGFGEKDLASILFFASDCSYMEFEISFSVARTYGLRTIRHLRGIILKNRAVAIQPYLEALGALVDVKTRQDIAIWSNTKYPDVAKLRKLYEFRVQHVKQGKSRFRFVWNELDNQEEENADRPNHPAL
jgi:hypothetical protein